MDLETQDKQKKWFANYVNVGLIILTFLVAINGRTTINNGWEIQKFQAQLEKERLLNKFARNPLVEREKLQEWLVIRLREELKEGWDKKNFSSLDMKNSLIEYLSKQTSFNKTWTEGKQSIIFTTPKTNLANFLKDDPWIVIKKNHNSARNENLCDDLTFYLNQDEDYHEFFSLDEAMDFLKEKDGYFLQCK